MFSAATRCIGAFALFALAIGFSRAQDTDPEYDGKKTSAWVEIVQNDASARKRSLAVEALGKIWTAHKHKDTLPNIARALRIDTSVAVRAQAAIVLAGMRTDDQKYFKTDLVEALSKEKEARVRKEIIHAIHKFPEACALGVEPLIEALKDTDNAVKIEAAECLALAGNQAKTMAKSAAPGLVPLLKDTDKGVRQAAVYALGRIQPEGASTVAETMATMLGTEKDADMKRELVTAMGLLAEKSDPVVKALTVALVDPDEEVRRRSARVLGTFGTAAVSAADALLKVVGDDKVKDIRVDAVRAFGSALGPTGVKSRLKDLRPLLNPTKEPDFEVRLALVDEIASLGWEHLGQDLTSPDKAVKEAAMETIVALRLRQSDPQLKVREAASAAIKKIEKKPEPKKDPDKKEPE